MKTKNMFFVFCFFTSATAFAHCADTVCSVAMGSEQKAYFDFGECSGDPFAALTDKDGHILKNADGKVTILPSGPTQISFEPQTSDDYIVDGEESLNNNYTVVYKLKSGAEVFNLHLTWDASGHQTGTLSSTVPGLESNNSKVVCR